jgi:hypothetical protein
LLSRDVNVGPQEHWDPPRDEGFEYDWAQAGATSATLLSESQHSRLVQQIKDSQIDYGVLANGQNDFGPGTQAYLGIYHGTWTASQIDAYVGQVVGNIQTALETLLATGGKIILSNLIDSGATPQTRSSPSFMPRGGRGTEGPAIRPGGSACDVISGD